ncbi:SusC/RagA family TonB-linked outer membrane protein [Prolixibacteraceae bacterium JC049]|nr:SusC/RagA family TonB-linked outer membrane protein [Prolixibacteraceae bacterium JC049]
MKKNDYSWIAGFARYWTSKWFKTMRIIAFLILVTAFQSFAERVYSQTNKISLDVKSQSISQILDEIEKQTDFFFLFDATVVDVKQKTSINCSEKSIDKILDKVFVDTGITYKIVNRLIALKPSKTNSNQQKKLIKGTVTDDAGEPLPGVSVVVKGTTIGVTSDVDGNFSIEVSAQTILQFSFVGMEMQEVKVEGRSKINVTMRADAVDVDEVVVIGYGTQKKSNLTAAVEMVDTKVLENRPVKNVGEMLAGTISNLNITKNSGAPDAGQSFNIRGFTGFGTSGAPLILVDGVEQNINNLNGNDIEKISVLKDAAASAIYGSRAPNGVILIQTKSGRKGSKVRVNYSTSLNINEPTYMPASVNGLEYVKLRNMMGYNSGQPQWYSDEKMKHIQAYLDGTGPSNTRMPDGKWAIYRNATGSTDFYDEAFRDHSFDMMHNFDLSGGTDKSSFYMGIGYVDKEGIYDSDIDNYDRMSSILKVKTDVANWITVGMNARYSRTDTQRPSYRGQTNSAKSDELFFKNLGYFPNHPTHNPDGTINRLNPLGHLYGLTGDINKENNDLWVIPSLEFRPLKGLKVRSSFAWNNVNYNKVTTSFVPKFDLGDGVTFQKLNFAPSTERLSKTFSNKNYYQFEINAEYKKTIKKHSFTVLGGMQQELNKYKDLYADRTNFYTSSVPSFSTVYGDVMNIDDRLYDWSTRGYYFRLSYNYDEKYLLDFNSRYDASSRYSRDSRWAYFPSVSVGYNIAKEKFWPWSKINRFKITGSWGKSGNQNTGTTNSALYTYLPTLGTGTLNNVVLGDSFQPYVTMPPLLSNDLTWAKPRTIGFGLDIGAFDNRLQGEYRWYQRTVFDQVSPPELLPQTLGTDVPKTNNGVSETRGWEFSISWKDKISNVMGSPLKYGIKGMVSDYIGYVVEYGDPNVTGMRNDTWTPGERFGIQYGYESLGIATNKEFMTNNVPANNGWYYPGDLYFRDRDGDGRIGSGDNSVWYSQGDRKKLGYNYPRYRYSCILDASWKGFSLSVILEGVGHQKKYINNSSIFGYMGGFWASGEAYAFTEHLDLGGYWTADNPDAYFPRIYQNSWAKNSGRANDQYALNLAHLRIKNINLSYRIPERLVRKIKLASASLTFSVENAGFIYNKSWLKFDPANLREGARSYPLQRVYSFGIKLGI